MTTVLPDPRAGTEPPIRYRIDFLASTAAGRFYPAALPALHVEATDPAELPAAILAAAHRSFLDTRRTRQVTVAGHARRGRLLVGEHTTPFTVTELTGPAPGLTCGRCGDPYDPPPPWLSDLVPAGTCWSCA